MHGHDDKKLQFPDDQSGPGRHRFTFIHMNEMNVFSNDNMGVIHIYKGKSVTKVYYDRLGDRIYKQIEGMHTTCDYRGTTSMTYSFRTIRVDLRHRFTVIHIDKMNVFDQ